MKTKLNYVLCTIILSYFLFGTVNNSAQTPNQKPTDQPPKTQDSIDECITLEDMMKQIEARDKRLEANKKAKNYKTFSSPNDATNDQRNPNVDLLLTDDYNDLLTLELASRITGFDASQARKTHILKGMTGEILRYNWENGREEIKEKSASNRKRKVSLKTDIVQIKYVDFEADMDSFLDFIGLEDHPELSKINGVGESAYWNSKQNHLEVYAKGISFTLEVDISDDDTFDKEKTIALAKLIVKERIE